MTEVHYSVPRRDVYHQTVAHALEMDGWTITHDPLSYRLNDDQIFIDLGAERFIGAERGTRKIAVEVKSFIGVSPLTDLQEAIGQYVLYREFLEEIEPDRVLVLAVPESAASLFERRIGRKVVQTQNLTVIVYNANEEVILRWLPQPPDL